MIPNESGPEPVERAFFDALRAGDAEALTSILSDDFLIIDVLSGSEIGKSDLLGAIRSGQVRFHKIELVESRVRHYGLAAIVTGRTEMQGRFVDTPFAASSRYTHVYVKDQGRWKLVSAQGTPIRAT